MIATALAEVHRSCWLRRGPLACSVRRGAGFGGCGEQGWSRQPGVPPESAMLGRSTAHNARLTEVQWPPLLGAECLKSLSFPLPAAPIAEAAALIRAARRPIFYGGGGLINSGPAACALFATIVRRMNATCTLTLLGLGAFPASDSRFVGMLGMHGTVEANLAMHHADLVVCVGARSMIASPMRFFRSG